MCNANNSLIHALSISNKSVTFPFENAKNISRIALSPNGSILITVDEGKSCNKEKENN